jgi:hypothetical protein
VSHLILLTVRVLLVETPVAPQPDRFLSGTTGVMSGVGTNGRSVRRRCRRRT